MISTEDVYSLTIIVTAMTATVSPTAITSGSIIFCAGLPITYVLAGSCLKDPILF